MAQPLLPSYGERWTASLSNLATAYGWDEGKMATAVYAVAEQLHQHYCLSRGIVNHSESRPDQDVAVSFLSSLAGTDWWIAKSMDMRPSLETPTVYTEPVFSDDPTEGGL